MIFCTCSEVNQDIYLDRVKHWKDQFCDIDADLWVFVDGTIQRDKIIEYGLQKLTFVMFDDSLGRDNSKQCMFPGWKRSFKEALIRSNEYKYVTHIESDVLIKNKDTLKHYINKPGYYAGYSKVYGFMETAIMILNNKSYNDQIINYLTPQNINKNEVIEHVLAALFNWNIVFNGERFENDVHRIKQDMDYVSQHDWYNKYNDLTIVCVETTHPDIAEKLIKDQASIFNTSRTLLIKDRNIVSNIKDYNQFIIKELYKHIETPYVGIVQLDGYALNKDYWTNEFLKYDYIGAPWPDTVIGNGGFSIRSKKLMEACSKFEYNNTIPEDALICIYKRGDLEHQGFIFAPFELANKFSVENKPYSGQFGFHGKYTMRDLINKGIIK